MGILTQSQKMFLEKSNFQNCLLNQQMFTPGEKNLFLKNPTTILTSTNLSYIYDNFLLFFFLSNQKKLVPNKLFLISKMFTDIQNLG